MKIEWTAGGQTERVDCPAHTAFVGVRLFAADHTSRLNINAFDEPSDAVAGVWCHRHECSLPDGRYVRFYCYVYEDQAYARILRHFLGMKHLELTMGDFSLTVTV